MLCKGTGKVAGKEPFGLYDLGAMHLVRSRLHHTGGSVPEQPQSLLDIEEQYLTQLCHKPLLKLNVWLTE